MANNFGKCVRIEMEYESGRVMAAEGDQAEFIARWWNSCEGLAFAHEMRFQGAPLQVKVEPREVEPRG